MLDSRNGMGKHVGTAATFAEACTDSTAYFL